MAYVNNPPSMPQMGGFGGYGGSPVFNPNGQTPGIIPNVSTGGQPVGAGGGSFWGWLASLGQDALTNPQVWQAGAQMLGAAGESASRNRREEQDREDETLDMLQRSDYMRSRPENLDTYTSGPSSRARKSADDLQGVLMDRLANASAGPSFWERFATIGAPVAGIYGAMGTPGLRR